MKTKTCTGCGATKPLTEFHKHRPSKDGLKPRCKSCQIAAERARRIEPDHRAVQAWHDLNKRVLNQTEYAGVEVRITKAAFVTWATAAFAEWFETSPNTKPSIDREDPAGHYELGNIRMISLSDNCRRARKNKNVHAAPGLAWCGTCRDYKPREAFGMNASKSHGLQTNCKECRRNRRIRDKASRSSGKTGADR